MASGQKARVAIFIVDTFSDKPFHGSSCPVCVLPHHMVLDEKTMENISVELNMAEVAFIRPMRATDDMSTCDRLEVRWFNPTREVRLCGHGTIATAAVLFHCLGNRRSNVTCHTRFIGDLIVRQDGHAILVDFPLGVTVRQTNRDLYRAVVATRKWTLAEYDAILKSLGTARKEVQEVALCARLRYLLIRLKDGWSRQQFEQWRCDIRQIEAVATCTDIILVIVTLAGSGELGYTDEEGAVYDFVSRVFVPFAVRKEDPVTGSAHTVLAHYWSEELGKTSLHSRQCSHRGGEVRMQVAGERVHISAHATVVMKGVISV